MYYWGEGVSEDYGEALTWLYQAAEQGNSIAQNNLGNIYHNGPAIKKDYGHAVKWYRLSAEQGHANARYNLGFMYYNGKGVSQDYIEAAKWYYLAAEQGNISSRYNLGVVYSQRLDERYDGTVFVTEDHAMTMSWDHRPVAELGNLYARNSLGILYFLGQGVQKNHILSHMWFNLAGASGLEEARGTRDTVTKLMTPAQIAEAQRLAREWTAAHRAGTE